MSPSESADEPPPYTATLRETGSQVAVTVPRPLVEALDLWAGDVVRYVPYLDTTNAGPSIHFRIETRDISGEYAHERAVSGSSRSRHISLYWPLPLADAVGLRERAIEGPETTIHFESPNDETGALLLSMQPACYPWQSTSDYECSIPESVRELNPVERRLQRTHNEDQPLGIHNYVIELPAAYQRAYELEGSQSISFRVGTNADQSALAAVMDFRRGGRRGPTVNEGDEDRWLVQREKPVHRIQSRQSGADRSYQQFSIYPPKAVVHALGLHETELVLVPKPGRISIVREDDYQT